jgi:hypothetical protein
MIRITFKEEVISKIESRSPGEASMEMFKPQCRVVDYPGCNGAMPFMGNADMTAIVIVSKTNPAQGPHEVVAVIENNNVERIEEVQDEG